tara:strand:- start:17033 stop:17434 length:402 start_codon:yes stop_codon:yes gene_type:complete
MKLSNKIKRLLKKYWYAILICIAVLLLFIAFITQVFDKNLLIKAFDFFNKNINEYTKYNNKIDDEAFEKVERINKRKKEIAKKINKEFENREKKIRNDINKKVKEELNKLNEDEEALESWYNDFLNSNIVTNN